MMNKSNKQNHWKYLSIGLLAVLTVSLVIPRADAASDINQLTQQILNLVKNSTFGTQAIKNAINALQTSVNGLNTEQSYAITVVVSEPQEVVILPLEAGIMYRGHITGFMSIGEVDNNGMDLDCDLTGQNSLTSVLALLDNESPGELQVVAVEKDFTCRSLTVDAAGVDDQTLAVLAIDYSVIDGIQEIETSP